MAEAKINKVTKVVTVSEDVTLTMSKDEAERIFSLLAKVRASDGTHSVYDALRKALGADYSGPFKITTGYPDEPVTTIRIIRR